MALSYIGNGRLIHNAAAKMEFRASRNEEPVYIRRMPTLHHAEEEAIASHVAALGYSGLDITIADLHNFIQNELNIPESHISEFNNNLCGRAFNVPAGELKINKEAPLSRLIKELTKPSTIHFWTFTANNTETPLPAILLTDTQGLRQMPPPPEVCVKGCPAKEWLTQDRVDFMDTTVRALTRTLMSRQGIQLPQTDAGVTSLPSLVMTLMIVLTVRIYQ
nr:uncharacterized protein LOC128693379 [Cherax quadricarinatus]